MDIKETSHAMDARERADLYLLLSSVFRKEPTNEELAALVELGRASDDPEAVNPIELDLLRGLASYSGEAIDDLGTRVRTEYAELFLGPRKHLAPLHESMYVGYPNRTFTDVTRSVRSFYLEAGFEVENKNKEPDDAIGFECGFMSELCSREAQFEELGNAADAGEVRSLELAFLEGHLGVWVERFAERIKEAWCGDYYSLWADYLCGFVESDIDRLKRGKI